MKKIIIASLVLTSALLTSCDEKDTANVSKITNYPIITVSGDDPYFVPQGATYVDPVLLPWKVLTK
jgi:hypothetical protein